MKNLVNAIKVRVIYCRLLLGGNLSFSLATFLILPSLIRPDINKIKSFSLYGKPIVVPKGEGSLLTSLIHQIIGLNQYHVELIKKRGTVVDAGANIGIFSIFAAIKHKDSTIYAFEPAPLTFEVLKENTKYYNNIKAFSSGLGEKEKKSFVIITDHSSANHIGESGIPVDIKTIDGFNIPVNFIKIDAEGYEANILDGATETIRKNRPVVVMSAYHKPNDKIELPKLINNITPYNCELRCDYEEDFVCRPIL